jgi:hypothetical protein
MKIMNLKRYTLLIAATITLFGLLVLSGYAQKRGSGKVMWEYKSAIGLSDQQMNALGMEGWEMVGFSVDDNGNKFMYFKRSR